VKRPTIIEVAAFAGIAAFLWTIVSSKPPREPPGSSPRTGMAGGPMSFRDPPTDIPGLRLRVRNDPGDHFGLYCLARRYDMLGQPDKARQAWTQLAANTESLSPETRTFGRNLFLRAQALRALGRAEEARDLFARCAEWYTRRMEENPNFNTNRALLIRLGWARKLAGDEPGAREAWKMALDTLWGIPDDGSDPMGSYDKAAVLCLLGRPEQGLVALTLAAEGGYDDPEGALNDEAFTEIRADERFLRTIDWIRSTDQARRWIEFQGSRSGRPLRAAGGRQL
jgi:tetratricopeptide (TPR) repeat protein